MKVALLSILVSFHTLAFAQDCADCGPKKLPTPLEQTAINALAITEKLKNPTSWTSFCAGKIACEKSVNSGSNLLVCDEVNDESFKLGKCGLEQQEMAMISYYAGNGHICMNPYLRNSAKTNTEIDAIVKILNDGLSKLPSYKGFVRRGANLPQEIRDKHKVGSIVNYASFTSTSTHVGFEGEDIFYIFSKTGKPIMSLVFLDYEYEVLFKSNTNFKVLSVERIDDVNYYVMKEVSPGSKAEDEAEDKAILKKVKSAPKVTPDLYNYEDKDGKKYADAFSCPVGSNVKVPASVKQKKMPGFKVPMPAEEF